MGRTAMIPRKTSLRPALEQATTAHSHFYFAVGNHWRWFVRLTAIARPGLLLSSVHCIWGLLWKGFLRNDGVREETHVCSRAIMTWKCGVVAHLTPAICEDLFC
ncbi:hypothetical protein TcG_12618 [Trypanosoma cruzi]|nr:hypothetical protein TcG_12618 [Trypanosoma cruzi]